MKRATAIGIGYCNPNWRNEEQLMRQLIFDLSRICAIDPLEPNPCQKCFFVGLTIRVAGLSQSTARSLSPYAPLAKQDSSWLIGYPIPLSKRGASPRRVDGMFVSFGRMADASTFRVSPLSARLFAGSSKERRRGFPSETHRLCVTPPRSRRQDSSQFGHGLGARHGKAH
jgi:hypothetical protein